MADLRDAYVQLKELGLVADDKDFSLHWLDRPATYYQEKIASRNLGGLFFLMDDVAARLENIIAAMPAKSPVTKVLMKLAGELRSESARKHPPEAAASDAPQMEFFGVQPGNSRATFEAWLADDEPAHCHPRRSMRRRTGAHRRSTGSF